MAATAEEAKQVAAQIGYPVLVRPSYVLGGRAMAIVYDEESLDDYVRTAVGFTPDRPVLIDKFLEQAAEFDVDALADENDLRDCRNPGTHRRGGHSFGRFVVRVAARSASIRSTSRRCVTTRASWRRRCQFAD